MRPLKSSAALTVRRVVGRNVAGNSGDLTADGLNLAGADLKVLGVALGQNQVAPGISERLGQSEADPLTGAGNDAAVAAQVEKVPGYVGDRERHEVFLHISRHLPASSLSLAG